MRDYRLSEIKEICESMRGNGGCIKCSLYPEVCIDMICDTIPNKWDVKPHDMIELPCKQEIKFSEERSEWQVVWRDDFIQRIRFADFTTESEADAFLEKLKGGKQ